MNLVYQVKHKNSWTVRKFILSFKWEHILCWQTGSHCAVSVFWDTWGILTADFDTEKIGQFSALWETPIRFIFFYWKFVKIWLVTTLLKFHLQGGGVLTSNWAPRTVDLLLIPAIQKKILHKGFCVYKPLFINLYTGLAQKIKAILFSKHRRGHIYVYMASAQSVKL